MPVKKSLSLLYISIVYLSGLVLLEMTDAGEIDLNMGPDGRSEESSGSEPAKPVPGLSSISSKKTTNATRKGPQISEEFYEKVLKLFNVLRVCDTDDFDIKRQIIPDNFSAQNKAIMALTTIAANKLIKKKDIARHNRIMKNCLELAKAYKDKQELLISVDSQTSGGTREDRLARLRQSPLEGMKHRFVEGSDRREIGHEQKSSSKPILPDGKINNYPASIEFEQIATQDQKQEASEFIQFF